MAYASSHIPALTGRGVGIAILDTGVSPVADFTLPQNRIVCFRDFVNGRTQPYDDNGHGTHVTYFPTAKAPGTQSVRGPLVNELYANQSSGVFCLVPAVSKTSLPQPG